MKKNFIKFITTFFLFAPIRPLIWKGITFLVFLKRKKDILYIYYKPKTEDKLLDLILRITKETNMQFSVLAAGNIYKLVSSLEKVGGDIAEVGVFRGGSACIIKEASPNKNLHLFDTFEGLPKPGEKDDHVNFFEGQFKVIFEDVKNTLNKYKNVFFYKGLFPASAKGLKVTQYSFVHLDVDLYESTTECLKYFYPKMVKGGVIISHDYVHSKAIKIAFDEFFADKPEIIIELPASDQCLVVKL